MQRGSGILLHITSLPGPYGIGTMGKEAYAFVDFLQNAKQTYWQILPLGPTSYGNSPYQSFSTFAGNPYLIDLDLLAESGALTKEDLAALPHPASLEQVDYGMLFAHRFALLKKAWLHDKEILAEEIATFRTKNAYWIENYGMYMALKFESGQQSYQNWDASIRLRQPDAMADAFLRLKDDIDFWVYLQYRFFEQWNALKTYANEKGISIIGDIPIYVAEDSADAWAHHEVLMLDEDRLPLQVAGCPPDYFSEKGQLWGNPIYNWTALKAQNYEWWIARMRAALSLYDIVRIDHFRAFSAYYSIPYGREDAVVGEWIPGPGMDLFHALKGALGENLPIIAEDLGFMDDGVRNLLRDTGFPGMKVMQFGLVPDENSEYLPHNYPKNSVSYIGTHDNIPLCGWLEDASDAEREFALRYARAGQHNHHWSFIETLLASPADISIITMQDLLGLGKPSRMNTPAIPDGNWCWRLKDMSCFTADLENKLSTLTRTFSR